MANLGTLTLDLVAKIGGFVGPLDKAGRQSKKTSDEVSKSFNDSIKSITKWGAAIGAGAAAAAIAFTKSSLKAADAIGKVAKTAGVSTDTIQEMRHAASLSGIAFGDLDQGMQQFNKRVGELRAGTGSLYTYLNKVNKELVNQIKTAGSTDAALNLIFKSMKNVTNESDRAALAAAAFGRSGQRIAIMADDYEKLRQEARDLGLVIDSELIKNAEIANDKMDTMSRIIKTQLTSALLNLAPAIQTVAQGLIDLSPGFSWLLGGEKRVNERQQELNAITIEMQDLNKLLNEQRDIQARLLMLKAQGSWYDPNELEQVNNNIESIVESVKDLNSQSQNILNPVNNKPSTSDGFTTEIKDTSWGDFGKVIEQTSKVNKQRLELIKSSNAAISAENNRMLQDNIARDAALRQLVEEADVAELNNKYTGVELELKLHEHKFEKLKELYTEGSKELSEIERLETAERIKIEKDAQATREGIYSSNLQNVSSMFDTMAGLAGQFAGKQKGIYKTLFLASKAAALADAIVNLHSVISKATASAPPPWNIPAIATATIQGGVPIAGILATTISGLAHEGINEIPKSGTWLLEKGERVTTGQTSKKLDDTLNRIQADIGIASSGNYSYDKKLGGRQEVHYHHHFDGPVFLNRAQIKDSARMFIDEFNNEMTRKGKVPVF